MKLLSFSIPGSPDQIHPGFLKGEMIFPLPYDSMLSVIEAASNTPGGINQITKTIQKAAGVPRGDARLHAPLPNPRSLRDAYAFEKHVATANANRNRPVPEEWYQFPVFYFSNHLVIYGPDETIPYPASTQAISSS